MPTALSVLEVLQLAQLAVLLFGFVGVFVRWGRLIERIDMMGKQLEVLFAKDGERSRLLGAIGERVARLEGRSSGGGGEDEALARYRKEVSGG